MNLVSSPSYWYPLGDISKRRVVLTSGMHASAILDARGEDAAAVPLPPSLDGQTVRERRGLTLADANPLDARVIAAQHFEALVRALGPAPRHADAVLQVFADPGCQLSGAVQLALTPSGSRYKAQRMEIKIG